MSNNVINIDVIKREIGEFSLSPNLNQSGYADLFYDHLTGMLKFRMLADKNDVDTLKLNEKTYFGLEQYIFDHTEVVEKEKPNDMIDWNTIDLAKDILRDRISKILGRESKSNTLKPIIDFTVNTYENSLIYKNLHPKSLSNPWMPTDQILLKNGYMVLVSDERDLVSSYNRKIIDKVKEDSSALFVVAASNKKDMPFSGFPIDNRSNSQGLVYEFLKREAKGISAAKNSKQIVNFLNGQNRIYTEQEVKMRVLLPLKRAGLVGSTTAGYFHIETKHDLIQSYQHHKEKISGIQKTINMHKLKAIQMGFVLD